MMASEDKFDCIYTCMRNFPVKTVRYCASSQMEMLEEKSEKAAPVFDALNILGTCPWRINKKASGHLDLTKCIILMKMNSV